MATDQKPTPTGPAEIAGTAFGALVIVVVYAGIAWMMARAIGLL